MGNGWRFAMDEGLEAGWLIAWTRLAIARAPVDEVQVVAEVDGDVVRMPRLEPGLAGEPVLADVAGQDDAILVV
jgi:hypothetical protein